MPRYVTKKVSPSVKQKVIDVDLNRNQVTLVSNNGKRYNVPLPNGMKLNINDFVEVDVKNWSIIFSHITPNRENEFTLEEQRFRSEQLDGCY